MSGFVNVEVCECQVPRMSASVNVEVRECRGPRMLGHSLKKIKKFLHGLGLWKSDYLEQIRTQHSKGNSRRKGKQQK